MKARFSFTGGEQGEAMSLIELRDHLSAIIAENDRRGWSERNTHAVMIEIPQPKTPVGRMRPDQYAPVRCALETPYGLVGWDYATMAKGSGVYIIRAGGILEQASQINTRAKRPGT